MKHTRREFVRTLFVASQAAIASRFLPSNLFAETVPADGLNFLVFGDWGRRGESDQVQVATEMARAAKDMSAKFVISVGDNFYEDGVQSTDDPHWHVSFENVYDAKSLQVPWHVILGNHDYNGNCDAQIAYGQSNARWNCPARYYMQSHQLDDLTTADFFYIDTSPMVTLYRYASRMRANITSQDIPKQLDWLKTSLANSKAQWKIVFGHHPIYSGGGHGDTQELIRDVLPLLREHKVQAYFNGHDHDLQHLVAGEINFFDSGAGSQHTPTFPTRLTKFSASSSGFTTVSLKNDAMAIRMIDNHGKLLYSTSVPRIPA